MTKNQPTVVLSTNGRGLNCQTNHTRPNLTVQEVQTSNISMLYMVAIQDFAAIMIMLLQYILNSV